MCGSAELTPTAAKRTTHFCQHLARVLYGCVKMSISRYVCSDSVAFSARRRSTRRRPSTRTSARGTPPPSRRCTGYAPLSARRTPRRTALGRSPTHARPLCAAAPPMRARARACACSYAYKRAYVDGLPLDAHKCSSNIELPLHPGLSMSNAHMHGPFPRCMYK